MPEKLRIGLIGLGNFCSNYHIKNLLNLKDVEVTAVCDVSQDRLERRNPGLQSSREFSDHRDLIDADLTDCLHVSTPNCFHFEICKSALEKRLPVMVDKPMTRTVEQAEELVALSKSNNTILMTAYTRHFMASSVHVRQKVTSGEAGPLQTISAIQRKSTMQKVDVSGGMLFSRSVHITDICPWLAGQRIVAVEANVDLADNGFETFVDTRMELDSGVPVRFIMIQDTKAYQDEVNVFCRDQSFRLERDKLYVEGRNNWIPEEDLPDCGNSTDHFVQVAKGNAEAIDNSPTNLNGEDGLQAIKVIEAILESGRTGRSVEV